MQRTRRRFQRGVPVRCDVVKRGLPVVQALLILSNQFGLQILVRLTQFSDDRRGSLWGLGDGMQQL